MICGKEFYANLLVIDFVDFDVILGMNWLRTSNTVINCKKITVVFRIPKHPKFQFLDGNKSLEPVVYRAKPIERVLIVVDANEKPILAVYEYLDVFP